MALFKKKEKKKKEKKPITTDRVIKWLSPVFIIGVILFAGYSTFKSCGYGLDELVQLEEELTAEFDVNTMLSANKILPSDKQTLKEKLSGVPIFIQGEISADVFNNLLNIDIDNDLDLTDCEFGEFVNAIYGGDEELLGFKVHELSLEIGEDNCYNMTSVVEIDLSQVELDIDINVEISKMYIKSDAKIEIDKNRVKLVSVNSQMNKLSNKNNETILELISAMFGYKYDFSSELIIDLMNDFALKTATEIELANHRVSYFIK